MPRRSSLRCAACIIRRGGEPSHWTWPDILGRPFPVRSRPGLRGGRRQRARVGWAAALRRWCGICAGGMKPPDLSADRVNPLCRPVGPRSRSDRNGGEAGRRTGRPPPDGMGNGPETRSAPEPPMTPSPSPPLRAPQVGPRAPPTSLPGRSRRLQGHAGRIRGGPQHSRNSCSSG